MDNFDLGHLSQRRVGSQPGVGGGLAVPPVHQRHLHPAAEGVEHVGVRMGRIVRHPCCALPWHGNRLPLGVARRIAAQHQVGALAHGGNQGILVQREILQHAIGWRTCSQCGVLEHGLTQVQPHDLLARRIGIGHVEQVVAAQVDFDDLVAIARNTRPAHAGFAQIGHAAYEQEALRQGGVGGAGNDPGAVGRKVQRGHIQPPQTEFARNGRTKDGHGLVGWRTHARPQDARVHVSLGFRLAGFRFLELVKREGLAVGQPAHQILVHARKDSTHVLAVGHIQDVQGSVFGAPSRNSVSHMATIPGRHKVVDGMGHAGGTCFDLGVLQDAFGATQAIAHHQLELALALGALQVKQLTIR